MPFASPLPVEIYDQICHYLVKDVDERKLHVPTRRHDDSVVQSWEALKTLRLVDRNASQAASRVLFRQLRFPSLMEEDRGGIEADIERLEEIKGSPCLWWVEEISLHLFHIWDKDSHAWWGRLDEMPEGEGLDVAAKQLSSHALFMSGLPRSRRLTITWTVLIANEEEQRAMKEKWRSIEPLTVILYLLQICGVEYDELVIESGLDQVQEGDDSVQELRDDFLLMGRFNKFPHKDASCDAVLKLQGCTEEIFEKDAYLKRVKGCSLISGIDSGKGAVRHLILCHLILIDYGLEAMYELELTSLTLEENDHDFMRRVTDRNSMSERPILETLGKFTKQMTATLTTVHVSPSFYYLFDYTPNLDFMRSPIWSSFLDPLSRCPQLREVSVKGMNYRRGRWSRRFCSHHPEIKYLMDESTQAGLEADMLDSHGQSTLVLASLFWCDLRSMEKLRTHLLSRANEEASRGAATESLRETADALGATCAVIRKAHEGGRLELLEVVPRKDWE